MKNKVIACLVLISCVAAVSAFAQQQAACGDADQDGAVTIIDALILAKCYIGIQTCPPFSTGDVNCSGAIDIIDALRVAQYYVGIIASLSCCPTNTTTVWIGVDAGFQCAPLEYPTLQDAVLELQSNGINVFNTATLSTPVCAACGCPDGRTWVAMIMRTNLDKALALGWREMSSFTLPSSGN